MISENVKQEIAQRLESFINLHGSAKKASLLLEDVSEGVISFIRNGKWDSVSDRMWRKIAAQIGYDMREWIIADISSTSKLVNLFSDAQNEALSIAVTANAGCGKSEAAKAYARSHPNVILLSCSEFWNRKVFLLEIFKALSKDSTERTVGNMLDEVVRIIRQMDNPVIMLDEADKLSDQVLHFFITLYNSLQGICGFVLFATSYLEKRLKRGVANNTKGYNEIWSRLGRKVINVDAITAEDIAMICKANGVTEKAIVDEIIRDSELDLRRVKVKVIAWQMTQARHNA